MKTPYILVRFSKILQVSLQEALKTIFNFIGLHPKEAQFTEKSNANK